MLVRVLKLKGNMQVLNMMLGLSNNGAVRPLFALPADAKRRNYYGADRPFDGYLGDVPGFPGYESVAIVDGTKDESVRDFARLLWPDAGDNNDGFW